MAKLGIVEQHELDDIRMRCLSAHPPDAPLRVDARTLRALVEGYAVWRGLQEGTAAAAGAARDMLAKAEWERDALLRAADAACQGFPDVPKHAQDALRAVVDRVMPVDGPGSGGAEAMPVTAVGELLKAAEALWQSATGDRRDERVLVCSANLQALRDAQLRVLGGVDLCGGDVEVAPLRTGAEGELPSTQEDGVWTVGTHEEAATARSHRTGVHLDSSDFTHDARLHVNGDFRDDAEKLAYAEEIARRLNQWQDLAADGRRLDGAPEATP